MSFPPGGLIRIYDANGEHLFYTLNGEHLFYTLTGSFTGVEWDFGGFYGGPPYPMGFWVGITNGYGYFTTNPGPGDLS